MKLNSVRISLFISIFSFNFSFSQTAVNMSSQPGYTYSENFSDIANWTFNTSPANGTFLSGTGSSAWKGNATNSSGNIPDGIKITTASTSFTTSTTGGVQKGSGNLVLLTTGATDNSSSVAIDLYLNYTSLSAGTLSFDWSSINNSTGDRNSSLKVFTSSDGINFTELVGARVTNFTNNNVTFGSITNVNLPSDFNQKTFAIIRFYIHNGIGTGQIGGSRPKISIDNVVVTGNALSACTTPSLQPTNLSFTTIGSSSVQGNFTASASNPDGYLMLMSSNSSLGALPTNGTAYNIGDNIGDANIVGNGSNTNFTLSSLSSNATYYLYVFALNSNCTGGPVYQTTNPLSGNVTTATGIFPCIAPSSQATSLTFSNITTNSIQGNFSISSGADEWLVVRRTSASLTSNPINTTVYNIGDALGGGVVVGRTTTGAFVANSLNLGTTYYFFIFSLNSVNCSDGPVYYITNPLGGNATTSASYSTSCVTPVSQPGNFISNGDNSSITASFSNVVDADSYLVLYSTSSSLSEQPQNNNNYIVGNSLGNATVLSISNSNSIYLSGLTASTSYYFFVYAKNTFCNGGTKYNLAAPLIASKATTATSTYNPYFGNLHAHSKYSDGNKDNPTFTPANNYAYAKNSQKMDFLGISEHNHSDAYMNILNWSKGLYQADTSTNSSFVALYGQEWGVISNGGHALVYGIDSLIGWEANNFDVFVPKGDYTGTPSTTGTTGLFRMLNLQKKAFVSLAHPDNADYNNIYGSIYNSTADSAIVGSAIESGNAFSTNTTYNDPPSSLKYISYYNKMLAKGYHLGPLMDHDTHYTNFGRSNENRLVVLAASLTKANLLAALKSRRFYATQDIDTRVNFTVNNQPMGSIFSGSIAPIIYATASDPTSPSSTPTIKLMYGTPGSGVNAVQLTSVSSYTLNYVDNNLVTSGTYYYYLDITINGKRTITAPIWYTKNPCSFDSNNPIATWYGSTNSSITNANNWCGGLLPPNSSNIIISASALTTLQIGINDTLIVNNLTVETGASLTINGVLKVKSQVLNNGTIDATNGTIEFNGITAQTLFNTTNNTIAKLVINNSANVSINATTNISEVLYLNAGTLNTNGNLILKSDVNKTARVAEILSGASISGNVTVERYFPAKRTWRLVTVPLRGSGSNITIQSGWQNNGGAATPNYGIELWHPSANNGFVSAGGAGNIRKYIPNSGWSTLTNTNVNTLADLDLGGLNAANNAYAVFITGPYGGNNITNGLSIPTTSRVTGKLQTGQQNFSISNVNGEYNLIGNPYASPLDLDLVKASNTNINSIFYLWDPLLSSFGGYVTLTRNGSNDFIYAPDNGKGYRQIQSGQAFFVRSNGSGNSLIIQENHKSSNSYNYTFRPSNGTIERLGINLSYKSSDSTYQIADGVTAIYDTNYSKNITDEFDVTKFNNTSETFSIKRNNTFLAMEARPLIDDKDTIYLNTAGLRNLEYQFELKPQNMASNGLQAYLVDDFNNSESFISLTNNSTYNFIVNGNQASYALSRFKIIFKPIIPLFSSLITLNGLAQNNNIKLVWTGRINDNVDYFEVEKSEEGVNYKSIATIGFNGLTTYEFADFNPNEGNNFYRVKIKLKSGEVQYSNVVNIRFGNNKKNLIVATNPVVNKSLNLQFEHVKSGVYDLLITNNLGQYIYRKQINHSGGSNVFQVNLNTINTGIFSVQLINIKKSVIVFAQNILID